VNRFTHEQVRLIAASIAKMVADRRPDIATIERLVRDRNGKVYLDFGPNGRGRTTAAFIPLVLFPGLRFRPPSDGKNYINRSILWHSQYEPFSNGYLAAHAESANRVLDDNTSPIKLL